VSGTHRTSDAARRELIESVFEAALDLAPERRGAWLAARCGADHGLRREVEQLLAGLERPDPMLDAGGARIARLVDQLLPHPVPRVACGPYRLLRELGRGGMGAVFLADRADGQYERRVAIKLLLPDHRLPAQHDRFLTERQILASLSHPNIAQLLDGGIADDGTPYLVMEHVDGLPITEHVARADLDLPARLRLFQDVCAAVHHAHRNLVLHLDIKPGNILVSSSGTVKLLDFGIAKLLDAERVSGASSLTASNGRPLTPAYASPEQLRAAPLSTASDIYALGLVLYELLTGERAHDLTGLSPVEAARVVCDEEPLRPSARGGRFARALRGDLDAIVMMTLRKDPASRYGSADLLAADIDRYLDGFPVLAHRGSTAYRISRIVRRHRVAAVMGSALALALIAGTGVALRQAKLADEAQARAEAARRESDVVTGYLIDMFDPRSPGTERRDAVASAELVRRGVERAEELSHEPLAQARMFDALSRVQFNLGDADSSIVLMERALAVRERVLPIGDPVRTVSLERLAELNARAGHYARAESLATRALAQRRLGGAAAAPALVAGLRQLSGILVYRSEWVRAEALIEESVAAARTLPRDNDSLLVRTLESAAALQYRRGHAEKALAFLGEAERLTRNAATSAEHARHANTLLRMAEAVDALRGSPSERDSLARVALAEVEAAFGPGNGEIINTLNNAALLVRETPDERGPDALLRRALVIEDRLLDPMDGRRAETLTLMAHRRSREGHHATALAMLREANAITAHLYGREHSAFAGSLGDLADARLAAGDMAAAEADFRRAIAIREKVFGPGALITALSAEGLARVATARGQVAVADSIYREVRRVLLNYTTPPHPDVRRVDSALAQLARR
jgi:serine/threonine-protein kinase